jgi:hypothetical protein
MTDISKLRELLERVESATGQDREIDRCLFDMACGGLFWPENVSLWQSDRYSRAPREFTSSIDAAVALCERVLPGWVVLGLYDTAKGSGGWLVFQSCNVKLTNGENGAEARSATRPLALCAAILRAKIAMLEKGEA